MPVTMRLPAGLEALAAMLPSDRPSADGSGRSNPVLFAQPGSASGTVRPRSRPSGARRSGPARTRHWPGRRRAGCSPAAQRVESLLAQIRPAPGSRRRLDRPRSAGAMDLLGALHEAIDEGVGDAVDHRTAATSLERKTRERVAQLELDRARALLLRRPAHRGGRRQELPVAVEHRERPVDDSRCADALVGLVACCGW